VPASRTVVQAGVAVFVGLLALEHLLRPELAPSERFISEYARGWTQPVHVAAFLGWGVATGACAARAARFGERPVARGFTVGAFAVATAGTLLAAAFSTQTVAGEVPAGVERTRGGRLHDVGTLLILTGLLLAAIASLRLVPSFRYRITVAILGVVLVAIVPAMVLLGLDAPGIGQRGFVLTGCAFQWFFAARSGRTSSTAGQSPAPGRAAAESTDQAASGDATETRRA
jgi:hypothetical protein